MKKRLLILCATLLTSMMVYSCLTDSDPKDDDPGTGGTSIVNYQITESDLSGWTLSGTQMYATPELFYDAINGGVINYMSHDGMTESIQQDLDKPSDQTIKTTVVYYTVEKSAGDMLKQIETAPETGSIQELPGYTTDEAFYTSGLGTTITVFAKLKNCYLELLIGGMADETTAKQIAVQVLGIYESKMD